MKSKKILLLALALCMAIPAGLAGCAKKPQDSGEHNATCPNTNREHVYENGICDCGDGPVYPDAPSSITYVKPADTQKADGSAFNRYQCAEGYYEFEIGNSGEVWTSFSALSAGQYALYSLENSNGVTAVQYDASAHYIPGDENGYIGNPARVLENHQFYSSINCGEKHYNAEWRATYAFYGNSGDTVRVRFVKIAEAQWSPSYVTETIYAQEIKGQKAPEGGEGKYLVEVPYDSEYFYDESLGYYRMGSAEAPGEIIYVAITIPPTRLFESATFATINDDGNNLSLPNGTTEDGDYLLYDYSKFIPANGGDVNAEADPTANCYENYVNSDGVYPVNKELHQFLTLYTSKNRPSGILGETDETLLANAWLAPCYYYDTLIQGTESFPYTVGVGPFEITTKKRGYTYYTVKYENTDSSTLTSICNISTTHENAFLNINGHSYRGAFSVDFEVDATQGVDFYIGTQDGNSETFTVTITKLSEGTQADPVTIASSETAQTLSTKEILGLDGDMIYEGYYVFKATQSGTLNLSTSADVKILLGESYLDKDADTGVSSGSLSIVLGEGETSVDVLLYVSSKEAPVNAEVTVLFTPAA